MCYSSITIASYFIEKSGGRKTPMQLNKLTYIAHGWYLAIKDSPLIVDEVQAWKYGPMIPVLYNVFKAYKNECVPYKPIEETKYISPDDKVLLDKILDVYGKCEGTDLSALTHQDGTPWDTIWKKSGEFSVIPDKLIKDHYIEKAKNNV